MAGKIDDGGQAFPVPESDDAHGWQGMSLRDWFAGMALTGLMASPVMDATEWLEIAKDSYDAADCMIAVRAES